MELNDLFSSILVFFQENYNCTSAKIVLLLNENSSNKEIVLKLDSSNELSGEEVIIPIYFEGTLQANLILRLSNVKDFNLNVKLIQGLLSPLVNISQQNLKERKVLLTENIRLQKELKNKFRPHNIIGNSKSIESVFELSAQVSQSDATVLLLGESGVGKELVASAIHYNSDRASENFIKVNCAALAESLLESELFGHEKGAFTGANQLKKGRFELAENGTIFLDEIGD
ncbi:MAG: sigma-54 factor interaction domain-containing protein, partial [Bacteriovoracaceae bacterium]